MSQEPELLDSDLQTNRRDNLVVTAKGVLGAIPFVGSLIAEIVGAVIPNQRMDRIARLVSALGRQVKDIERGTLEQRLSTPLGVDLLEDAFHQASRAVSEERIEYIARVLVAGITEEEAKIGDKKFLMWLLGQLSDAEVVLLSWYGMLPNRDQVFEERHRHIIMPKVATLGSSREELDEWTLHESRKAHMVSLNLLRPRFKKTIKNQFPEFDDRTGMLKATGYDVTPLGRLLLRTIAAK